MINESVFLPEHKMNLSLQEAEAYFGIDQATLISLLTRPEYRPFFLVVGNTALVKRSPFEQVIQQIQSLPSCEGPYDMVQSSSNLNLENRINAPCAMPSLELEDSMKYKINRTITIGNQQKWIRADTEQEYADKLRALFSSFEAEQQKHLFSSYAWDWFNTYSKPNIAQCTATNYQRQITKYLIPSFGSHFVEDITPQDVQTLFNNMDVKKATKAKTRTVLNMIFQAAVEDGIIGSNPLLSRRVRISGGSSKTIPVYSREQMQYLVAHIGDVQNLNDRMFLALSVYHPLRLEEVLGLKWENIDLDHNIIQVRQVATHPTRNFPEVKAPKTESSVRDIGLCPDAAKHLVPQNGELFVLGGDKPYSYTQVRKMCDRIRRDTNFDEKITPSRFRTTVLTDMYAETKDIKATQEAAGHTTAAMTLQHYVKGRGTTHGISLVINNLYS